MSRVDYTRPSKDYTRPSTDYGSRYSKKYDSPSDSYSKPYVSPSKSYASSSSKVYGSGASSFAAASSYSPTTTAKPREYNLTPFSSRRTTRSSDVSLTPYTSRINRSLSSDAPPRPVVERQTSRESQARETPADVPKKTRTVELEVSSDSAHEPEGGNNDPDVRFLTSRATSPMDPDRDYRAGRPVHRGKRRILIARTKTKVYPAKIYKRRRDRPITTTCSVQVDADELDKYAGRVRRRERTSYGSHSSTNYAPKYAGVGSSYSSRPASTSSRKESTTTDRTLESPLSPPMSPSLKTPASPTQVEKTCAMWQKREQDRKKKKQEKPVLPKQSTFLNRNRHKSAADDSVFTGDDTDATAERETKREIETKDNSMGTLPHQSNFYSARKKQQLNQHLAAKAAKSTIIALTPENLNLKESIDKVKSWKKQLQQSPPESPQRRGKATESQSITRQLSRGSSREEQLTSPPPSSANKRRQTSKDRRMFAGVPQFPIDTETDATEDERILPRSASAVSSTPRRIPRLRKDRSPSPYDNLAEREALERRRPPPPRVIIDGRPVSPDERPDRRRGYLNNGNESVNFGDESSMASDDEYPEKLSLHRYPSIESMETQANDSLPRKDRHERARSVDSFATGTVSPSEYAGRQPGVFIGGVRDIDSLLDFTETEDDFDFSDDDESDYRQQDSASRHNQTSTAGVLSPVREEAFHYGANRYPPSNGSLTPPERLKVSDALSV